jgi:hypothetical protein
MKKPRLNFKRGFFMEFYKIYNSLKYSSVTSSGVEMLSGSTVKVLDSARTDN